MRSFQFIGFAFFLGFCHLIQVDETTAAATPKPREHGDLLRVKPLGGIKRIFQLPPFTLPKKPFTPKANVATPPRQIQRREVPFQQPFLGVPVQIENVEQTPAQNPPGNLYPALPKLLAPRPMIKPNETEAERAERIHKSFDRLLTFVEIVGQVDNYVSSKWKNLVKTVSNFYETEDEPYRVGAKQIYGTCPHAHAHAH